jgi:hypothetical protein
MARESTSGTAIPSDSPAAKARPLTLGLAAAPVTAGFLSQDPAEAAHVQSYSRTEPMRCESRPRVPSRSRFLGNAPGNPSLSFEDRARCFAWPARGTERFLGRDVSQFPLEGRGDNAVGSWEHESARARRAVWCRLGFAENGRRCLNHPGAEVRSILLRENESVASITTCKNEMQRSPWKERSSTF